MNALAKQFQVFSRAVGLSPKAPAEPERVFGKARQMTGFLATLTPEQRARVLARRGDDTFGDKRMAQVEA